MQVKKAKVEAIYPLSFLQQALLLHSLEEGVDQGFLQVKCVLKGKINLAAFQAAWRRNIQRHESLRTSVHWENLEKPVQVVHQEILLPFTFHDWSENSEPEQKAKFEELVNSEAGEALNLSQAPVLRIFLIKLSEDRHFLLWDCHHILADGWSASIILQDLLAFYEANCSGKNEIELPAIPSYKSYLNWVKKQDQTKAKTFWTGVLKGFEKPTLVGNRKQSQKSLENKFQTESLKLGEEQSQKLRDFSQKNQITLNTLMQGIWAILISRYVDQDDIAFGTIVSGRSIDLPNAELMAGMYMNVLPLRMRIDESEKFSDWLKSLQFQQAKIRDFEYINPDDILDSSSCAKGHLMFDSLVVFENMPLENISGGCLSIESFESGLTSNYALTLAVSPLKEIKAYLKYDSSIISEPQISWFFRNLTNLIEIIIENKSNSLGEITNLIAPLEIKEAQDQIKDSDQTISNDYQAPGNEVELKLLSIWESLLNIQPIGVSEDFFDLGGTSITAIRLFTEIEKQFNRKLQAISLLKHRTIRALSELVKDETKDEPWSALVPLRASGSKPPIFCLHAGGGHVFFYQDLAKHLGADQPVYALQRLDLDDLTQAALDSETQASHYLKEIRKVQPNGSYSLLAYCYSTSICWEIAKQLQEAGDSVLLMAIIDSPPFVPEFKGDQRTTIERVKGIANKARALDFSFIKTIWQGRIKQPIKAKLVSLVRDRETIKDQELIETLSATRESYNWKPLPVKVTLIRSSAWMSFAAYNEAISEWDNLALNGVDTYVVDGQHSTLFDEPEVKQLADQLKECLDKANQ